MKYILKLITLHFFIITVGVLFFTSIEPLLECGLSGELIYPSWYPCMVMLTGLIGAIPSFLFYFKDEPTRKQFLFRVVLHFIIIEALIMTEGWLFGWYDTLLNGLVIFGMIFAVYICVWFFSYRLNFSVAKDINDALKRINGDEEE